MNAKDVIKAELAQSHSWFMAMLADLKDALHTAPNPQSGNHAHWLAGHAVISEGALVCGRIEGKENPLAMWKDHFGRGGQPDPEAKGYPSLDEIMAEHEKLRARTLDVLDSMSEKELDRETDCPPEFAHMFGTAGRCFISLGLHFAFHAGQLADCRRAAGLAPKFG